MKRLILAALAAALFIPAAPAQAASPCIGAPANNPVASYSEQRQFVDAQAWWKGTADTGFAHAHLGACIPERETLTANIRFDVRIIMHSQKPVANYNFLSFVVKGPGYEKTTASFAPNFKCATGVATCEKWITYTLPVAAFNHSGLQEIRLRGGVSNVDANALRPSLNFNTTVSNGTPVQNITSTPWVIGKSWYGTDPTCCPSAGGQDFFYCQAGFRSDVTPLPDGPVASPFSPRLTMIDHGPNDVDPTHHTITLDADAHAVPPIPGTIINDGPGPFDGTVSISTTSGLHKLHQRTECSDSRGTNAGVLVTPFTVT